MSNVKSGTRQLDYCIIDGSAPFFAALSKKGDMNWSKVPFNELDADGTVDGMVADRIVEAFKRFIDEVAQIGYNSVTIDDIAHCVNHRFYPLRLQQKIESYLRLYKRLIDYATQRKIRVFLTTDLMFFNAHIDRSTRKKEKDLLIFFKHSLFQAFRMFPDVEGVIIRIGEADGVDVKGDFQSRIVVKTVRQCRRFLRGIIEICERCNKQVVLRTWTIGAFPIGDLMWNQQTFTALFSDLPTDNLIISHKFGETDFFRYQTMSPLLYEGNHRKIIEFQARREYEGFGEFISFVGFDYERYARYLQSCPSIAGISVWCQTGGWSHFDRITYLENSSIWVELNVFTTVKIFMESKTAEEAATEFIRIKTGCSDPETFITLLRLSDKVIKELWYIPEYAAKRLYFRRTRVPPLLYVFWDTIIINHTMRKVIRRFVHERREAIHDGYRALYKIEKMKSLAAQIGLDTRCFDFQYDTFRILASAREYYFSEWNDAIASHIREYVKDYKEKYPNGFHIEVDFSQVRAKKWLIKSIFWISLRRKPAYRWIDRLILLKFAWLVYPLFRMWEKRRMPSFTRNQAMGIETLFR